MKGHQGHSSVASSIMVRIETPAMLLVFFQGHVFVQTLLGTGPHSLTDPLADQGTWTSNSHQFHLLLNEVDKKRIRLTHITGDTGERHLGKETKV